MDFQNGTQSRWSIDRYKERLVAKGFTSNKNVDYFDIFEPLTRSSSIHVLIVLAYIF